MKSITDVVSGCLLLGLCAVGAWSVSSLPANEAGAVGPAGVPTAVLIIIAVLSCLLIINGILQAPMKRYWPEAAVFKKILLFIGLFYGYIISLNLLGDLFAGMENPPFASGCAFSISTFLFLVLALPLLGRRKPVEVFLVALLTTAVLVLSFGSFFQIMLP